MDSQKRISTNLFSGAYTPINLFQHQAQNQSMQQEPPTDKSTTPSKTPFFLNRLVVTPKLNFLEQPLNVKSRLANRIMQNMEVEPENPQTKVKRQLIFEEQQLNSTPKKICLPQTQFTSFKKNLVFQQEELEPPIQNFSEIIQSKFQKDYSQINVIGRGHFGTVYKCKNNYDNQIYAIKKTEANLKKNIDKTEAVNEAQALAFLSAKSDSPYIIRYYTAWMEGNQLYLAMEYCDASVYNISQQKKQKQDQFEEWEIKQILKDISSGLKCLHSSLIVHLDIKPENMLYQKNKQIYKIADLGLSRLSKLKKGEDINEGDARYLAPEILNDIDNYGVGELTKADIFSLGASLYELMINEDLPKNGEHWHRIRQGLNTHDFGKFGQKYSLKLKNLIIQLMHPDFRARPSANEILESDYLKEDKENQLKWERIRGGLLRKQLEELKNRNNFQRKQSF